MMFTCSAQLSVPIATSRGFAYINIFINTIHMYSGITSGRVLNGELLIMNEHLHIKLKINFLDTYHTFTQYLTSANQICKQCTLLMANVQVFSIS